MNRKRISLLLVLLICLSLLSRSQRPRAEFGPQQEVETRDPKICMHTRLTDEVEPWKIQKTFEMVREMGAPWDVEYFLWAAHEPRKGVYDWTHADLVVDHARNQGLTLIARLGYVPEWARPPETSHLYLDPDNYGDFADFAAAFVRHFRGRVSHIIIWNEPNLSQEWGYRRPDPEAYAELLKVVYPAIKRANPEVVVLAGALAPTLAPAGSEWGMNDLDYLQGMYEAGAAPYFDALAAHAYGWTFAPDAPADPGAVNFSRVELLHDIMLRNGDAAKPVFITEAGWNDHPRWTKAVRPAERIRYTVDAYRQADNWPWVQALCMWAFRYPRPTGTYQDYYTFVSSDFRPKPVYLGLQEFARGFDAESQLN
jgi:hypothetical protein